MHFLLYQSISGKPRPCLHREGTDPLLEAWRAGEREPHPNWTDPQFWARVAELHRQQEADLERRRLLREAKKAEA